MASSLVDRRQIRAARAMLGWSQAELGAALGVNQRQVRFWERRLPKSPKKLVAIENAFLAQGIQLQATPIVGVHIAEPIDRLAGLS